MERVLSVEEKIRRAEEIYARRQNTQIKPVAKVTVSNKKDIKLLRKMLIQVLICTSLYLIIYTIHQNQYVFSNDVLKKANEILSYDTNFFELYENAKNQIITWIKPKENGIGGAEEKEEEQNQEVIQQNNEAQEENKEEPQAKELTPEEQDIQKVKETSSFIKPIEGTISSVFGKREEATGNVPKNHTGTDIAASMGTKIKAATDGEVVLASEEGDYGKHLKIQIGEVSIIYAHCNNLYVKQGDKITQGQEIAEVGSTGNSTGPHLHFEVRLSEKIIDPQTILEL